MDYRISLLVVLGILLPQIQGKACDIKVRDFIEYEISCAPENVKVEETVKMDKVIETNGTNITDISMVNETTTTEVSDIASDDSDISQKAQKHCCTLYKKISHDVKYFEWGSSRCEISEKPKFDDIIVNGAYSDDGKCDIELKSNFTSIKGDGKLVEGEGLTAS